MHHKKGRKQIISNQRINLEAVTGGVLSEKVLSEISQTSQENTCARVSFLIKLQVEACTFNRKEAMAQVFSCEF